MTGTSTGSATKVSLAHLGISVFDFDRMIDFYTRVMGLIVSDTDALPRSDKRIAFLTSSASDHHQLVLVEGRHPEGPRTDPPFGGSLGSQLFQMSFRLPGLSTMRMMETRIRAEGLSNFVPMNHGNAWALYFRDPEFNAVELFVDTDWHVTQPCGFALDLSKTDDEILAETEAYCRSQAECTPMGEWQELQAARIAASQRTLT